MILGIGIDIAQVDRIESTLARFGERFLNRVFTPYEQAICLARYNPASALAMRFAVKEAFSKAVGLGMRGIGWREVETQHLPTGKPYLVLHGRAKKVALAMGLTAAHVSMTDEAGIGAVVVVVEGDSQIDKNELPADILFGSD